MVIASAGHTASQSLQAMQRSSPFGYRRSACSPRKRGLCGVFSSGNWTVTLRANKLRPVSDIPLSSSASSQGSKKSLTRASMFGLPSVEKVRPGRLHHHTQEDDPDQRHRNEPPPAQPHHLVVAIARERRADPEEAQQYERHLHRDPDEAIATRRGIADPPFVEQRPRSQPAAEEQDRRKAGVRI